MYSDADGEASFTLNTAIESNITLVVFSAPKEHLNYNMDVGFPKQRRYPYELKIANAKPEGFQPAADFRKWMKNGGNIHPNGGGWVGNGANVASSVYVGPYAMVRGGTVSGNTRIEGHAMVLGGNVSGNAIIKDNACVYNATISDNAIVEGNAWMEGGSVTQTANIKGNAFLFAGNFGNAVVVGGDAEMGSCSTDGVYLQFPYWRNGRDACDGKGANDPSNVDINSTFSNFSDNDMNFVMNTACGAASYDCANVEDGTAYLDNCGKCIGGTTGADSDDADNDGTIDCEEECPNDINKTVAGFCGCGVAENTCGIGNDEITYNITMLPMSDYTSTPVTLDGERIATAFNMTVAQLKAAFGTSVTYAAVNPNASLDANSSANAPGHWFDQNGQTVAWGDNAYLFSELNMTDLTANIGQYPDRSTNGDSYTIKQALVYNAGTSGNIQVTLVFNISISTITNIKNGVGAELSAKPNPTTGIITLSYPTAWQLVNTLGEIISQGTTQTIDLTAEAAGVYFVKHAEGVIRVIKN